LAEILVIGSREGIFSAAHDVADGGIAQALAEMAMRSGVGASVVVPTGEDPFVFMWSESATRVVVVVPPNENEKLLSLCAAKSFPVTHIGVVGEASNSLELSGVHSETVSLDILELRTISEETLPRLFG